MIYVYMYYILYIIKCKCIVYSKHIKCIYLYHVNDYILNDYIINDKMYIFILM